MKRHRTSTQDTADARALAAAKRRIVELETANTALQARVDRIVEAHASRCPHAAQLNDALWRLRQAQQDTAADYRRARTVLGQMRELTTEIIPAARALPEGDRG